MAKSFHKNEKGYLLIYVTIVVFVLTAITFTIATVAGSKYMNSKRVTYVENAISAAEAGVGATKYKLAENPGFTGFPLASPQVFYDRVSSSEGRATYVTDVTTKPNGQKVITSTGRVYRDSGDDSLVNEKKIEVTLRPVLRPMSGISLFAGSGGLSIGSQSKLYGDNIYVKGGITLAQSSSIGSAAEPVRLLQVANISCGVAADWPMACNASAPPINVSALGVGVYGNVCATDQPASSKIAGLQLGCAAPSYAQPYFNKQEFVGRMNSAAKVTGASITQSCNGGTRTVPANTWITGSISATDISGCKVLFAGDVYVEGNITLNERSLFGVADTATGNGPTIVLNGKFIAQQAATFRGGDAFLKNSAGLSAYMISFYSNNSSCSNRIDETASACLLPADAKASAYLPDFDPSWMKATQYTALECGGSGGGNNFPGLSFFAYYATVDCYGGTKFGAMGGQGVNISFHTQRTLLPPVETPFGSYLTTTSYEFAGYRQLY